MSDRRNIVLVGMPGCGKSTVGILLAKALSRPFIDTDVDIQATEGATLRALVDTRGIDDLRETEERYAFSLNGRGAVIAGGGSLIDSERAMRHLKRHGVVVFLESKLSDLERRVGDLDSRGVVRRPGQTLSQLYEERLPLYRKYADVMIDCRSAPHDAIVARVREALGV